VKKTVLVVGASGLVGNAAVERFLRTDGEWDVISVSRREPEIPTSAVHRHIGLDLRDAERSWEVFSSLTEVTHFVYAALHEKPGLVPGWGERDYLEINSAMLRNVLEPLAESAERLEHVSILQGTKAYGFHLGPMTIPARERMPRNQHENFYWVQEDYLRAKSAEKGFAWTVLRPHLVVGKSYGVAMNLPPVIGAYAAVCREEGLDFGFPGGAAAPWESVDSRVVAGALEWAATAPAAVGEIFNVTNGEVFDWRDLWPSLADVLGMPPAADTPRALSTFLPGHAETWARIVKKHELHPTTITGVLGESHYLADLVFAHGLDQQPAPAFVSSIKIRQAGFGECMDTEVMWRYWLKDLMDRRIIPGADAHSS
jgi:nucleoside-diphosphate-sugar epimerase